jgi:hypothetical protein
MSGAGALALDCRLRPAMRCSLDVGLRLGKCRPPVGADVVLLGGAFVNGDGLALSGHGLPEPLGSATLVLHAAELRLVHATSMALPREPERSTHGGQRASLRCVA